MQFLFVFSADAPLGRLEYASLSQQALMGLFIEKIKNKKKICGTNEDLPDISEWKKVTLNKTEEIIEFDWNWLGLLGEVDLSWIPPTVTIAKIFSNKLSGTIDLTVLPDALKELYINDNRLSGVVDLTQLPAQMLELQLSYNDFCGTVNLTKLPPQMKTLWLNNNLFEGETDFSKLPKTLKRFSVMTTGLSGTVYIPKKNRFFVADYSGVKIVVRK